MLTINNLTKSFGKFTVLENIDLEFAPGVYGLLAPNGAGKTTLMNMIATLSHPTSGDILWNGVDIYSLGAEYRELIGYLPQLVGYYPYYTPRQFLSYIAALKGIDSRTAKMKIPEMLELVGLLDVADKKMKKFSGGMIQRVGIAQALLNNPKILILDEPTAGLDPRERVRFRNILTSISKESIVILSTHIVSDVESVAKQIIMLRDHRVFVQGSPTELCGSLSEPVYEVAIPDEKLDIFETQHFILSKRYDGNKLVLRFIGGDVPHDARLVPASLEDVFFATYQ